MAHNSCNKQCESGRSAVSRSLLLILVLIGTAAAHAQAAARSHNSNTSSRLRQKRLLPDPELYNQLASQQTMITAQPQPARVGSQLSA
jgi:hypothetical protein